MDPFIHGHNAIYYNRTIFAFGGKDFKGTLSLRSSGNNRLWFLDVGKYV